MSIHSEIVLRKKLIERSLDGVQDSINQIVLTICNTLSAHKKILLCGNGGSASDAQHFATELVVQFEKAKAADAAISLVSDSSVITAAGNDFSFEDIFSRQIRAIGERGDLLIAFSTSGTSPNIEKAISTAYTRGMHSILFTGNNKIKIDNDALTVFKAPSKRTCIIQEIHQMAYHIICAELDRIR